MMSTTPITPEILLRAYAVGIFPMAETADSPELFWFDPEMRGILPLEGFHTPHRLARTIRQGRFEMRRDSDFPAVLAACAESCPNRPQTWINADIKRLYTALYEQGYGHSVESWQDGVLVGGLYGVALGGAFFGESMFSRAPNASKAALVHLVHHLKTQGFTLLDTQFVTDHLSQFGAISIPRTLYRQKLAHAMTIRALF